MKSEVIPGPSRAILYLTQQCNMRCQHCWVGAAPDAPAASLADAVPDTAELLRALKALGVEHIGLTGGELSCSGASFIGLFSSVPDWAFL